VSLKLHTCINTAAVCEYLCAPFDVLVELLCLQLLQLASVSFTPRLAATFSRFTAGGGVFLVIHKKNSNQKIQNLPIRKLLINMFLSFTY